MMFGTLQKVDITEELITNVARAQYELYNDGNYDDQRNYVQGIWHDGAVDVLESFNCLADIFKDIDFKCAIYNCG